MRGGAAILALNAGGSINAEAPELVVWGAMLVAPFIVGLAVLKWILVRIQLSRD